MKNPKDLYTKAANGLTNESIIMIDAVVFDCDGTLSSIEGIVELARMNNVEKRVNELTERAMSIEGMSPSIYKERLDLVQPTRTQCQTLAQHYFDHKSPGLDTLIETLIDHDKALFVVSAGVNPSVQNFAQMLGINNKHVFAVDLSFDEQGHYVDFDHQSPMTKAQGKRQVVAKIKQHYPRLGYIGDGQNDVDVKDDVNCFIGYGGAYYRQSIEKQCRYYIHDPQIDIALELLLT